MNPRIPRIIEAITPIIAIIVIWRLVTAALAAGIDGVMFFGGVAAISGLGGYEIKEWVTRRRSKTPTGNSDT